MYAGGINVSIGARLGSGEVGGYWSWGRLDEPFLQLLQLASLFTSLPPSLPHSPPSPTGQQLQAYWQPLSTWAWAWCS
jgi:hypothetical protein